MNRFPVSLLITLGVALFLGALSVVAWRQGRARDVVAEHERMMEAIVLELDQRAGLNQKIRDLQSRARVVRDAEKLGLTVPSPSVVHWIAGGDR